MHFPAIDAAIEKIAVSDYGTVAVCESGRMFWWGCRPWVLRQSRLKAMGRDNSASVFSKLYVEYVSKFDDPRTALSRPEMVTLLGGPDAIFQQRLSEIGQKGENGCSKAEAVLELQEVYTAITASLQAGDIVVLCQEDPPMYPAGSKAIAVF